MRRAISSWSTRAENVYIIESGGCPGSLNVTRNSDDGSVQIDGPPRARQIAGGNDVIRGSLQVRPSPGVEVFSFTYG